VEQGQFDLARCPGAFPGIEDATVVSPRGPAVTCLSSGVSHTGEQRFHHLLETLPICIFVADLKVTPATILWANRRAELVYGYTAAQLVGTPATQLAPEEFTASVQNFVQRVQRGETVSTETTNRRRDGTTFPVRLIATRDLTNRGHMIAAVEDLTAERHRRSEADAIEAERLRIAHEIHDGVAQSLGALRLKSGLWSHLGRAASPAMRKELDEWRDVLASAIAETRRAIFALRPLELESGIWQALTQLVAAFGDQHQLIARLDVSGAPDALPASYQSAIFRIVQEGLHNVGRHTRASSVLVQLNVDPNGGVLLLLRDNGCGFEPKLARTAGNSGHFGLRHMRERVLDLCGKLDIRSTIGQGTELLIALPPAKEAAYATRSDPDRR
jgi:PAS domain S-box-containing protein